MRTPLILQGTTLPTAEAQPDAPATSHASPVTTGALPTTDTLDPGKRIAPATTRREMLALLRQNPGVRATLQEKALPGFQESESEGVGLRLIALLPNGNFEIGFEIQDPNLFTLLADPELYVVEATNTGRFVQILRVPEPKPEPVVTAPPVPANPPEVDLSKYEMNLAESAFVDKLKSDKTFMMAAFSHAMASMSDCVRDLVVRSRSDGNFDIQVRVGSIFRADTDRWSDPLIIDGHGKFQD